MTEYDYQQSIVQYRIPLDENGMPSGRAEILKRYTTSFNGTQKKKIVKKKVVVYDKEVKKEVKYL